MCPDCANTGYVMQDIGTATIPDFIEVRCRCNPEPTDADADAFHVPASAVPNGLGGYIDFAELARLDKEMNRERERALSQYGEPPLEECVYDCIDPDEYALLYAD